jgi:hypothetical protein
LVENVAFMRVTAQPKSFVYLLHNNAVACLSTLSYVSCCGCWILLAYGYTLRDKKQKRLSVLSDKGRVSKLSDGDGIGDK